MIRPMLMNWVVVSGDLEASALLACLVMAVKMLTMG
jgi:hypothetical protein